MNSTSYSKVAAVCALNHNARGGKHFLSLAVQIVFVINSDIGIENMKRLPAWEIKECTADIHASV
jgi:hypothetical protein